MRGLTLVGCVLLVVACSRENGAFDGSGAGASSTAGGDATKTDGVDDQGPGPGPASSPATGSGSGGADGETTRGTTSLTTGHAETTMNADGPDPTTTGNVDGAPGPMSDGMEGPASSTGFGPELCCLGEACEDDAIRECACNSDADCCGDWSLYCTAVAVQFCSLEMCIPPPGDCCEGNELFPGCADFEVMACVCAAPGLSDCCNIAWIMECAGYAGENCLPCG